MAAWKGHSVAALTQIDDTFTKHVAYAILKTQTQELDLY
jgi:hypothetical protein